MSYHKGHRNAFSNHFPTEVPITKNLICRGTISAAVGAVLGVMISFVVNITLVEISMSHFFTIYFGVIFVSVGLVVFWRISSQPRTEETAARRRQLSFFAGMVVLSGVLCFILKKNWFVGLSPALKVPVYCIIGTSVAFAMVFSLVDLINYGAGLLQASMARAVVESEQQARLVLVIAMLMGGIFGFIFGVMDVEDTVAYHVRLALMREEHYCHPIGIILGAVGGFGNEYLKHKEELHIKAQRTEFDEEI